MFVYNTTEYRTRVHCIHMLHLFCNALVHVIYSGIIVIIIMIIVKK